MVFNALNSSYLLWAAIACLLQSQDGRVQSVAPLCDGFQQLPLFPAECRQQLCSRVKENTTRAATSQSLITGTDTGREFRWSTTGVYVKYSCQKNQPSACVFWRWALQRRVAAAACRQGPQQEARFGRTFYWQKPGDAAFSCCSSARGPVATSAAPALVWRLGEKTHWLCVLWGSQASRAYSGVADHGARPSLCTVGLWVQHSGAALCSWRCLNHLRWRSLHCRRSNRLPPQSQIWGTWLCGGAASGRRQSSGCGCGAEGSGSTGHCSGRQACDSPEGYWTTSSKGDTMASDTLAAVQLESVSPGWTHTAVGNKRKQTV